MNCNTTHYRANSSSVPGDPTDRTARADRLRFAIGTSIAGLAFLAVALLNALWCVTHVVFSVPVALLIQGVAVGVIVGLWVVLPSLLRGSDERADERETGSASARSGT